MLLKTGFNVTTHDSYFTIVVKIFANHILAEKTYFANHVEQIEHRIMVLQPANRYKIVCQYHNFRNIIANDFQHHQFLH